jgi:phosphoglycolate phosphatase-like HAD superfamily hydrolase
MNFKAELQQFKPRHDFLIAIDSDGCVFDSMELKHKECFIPNIIKHWKLQAISKYVRQASEFVNLYSKWRGSNRFRSLVITFDLLREWPEVQKRSIQIPMADSLRQLIKEVKQVGNPILVEKLKQTNDPVLKTALEWSRGMNKSVDEIVNGLPPLPSVKPALEYLQDWADILVCSSTPLETLVKEWQEHDLAKYALVIAGQEMGSKKEQLALAIKGRYKIENVIMIGDAPGDLRAGKDNGAGFYPIIPGIEEECWKLFRDEAAGRFRNKTYCGEYEQSLIKKFENRLSDTPPWKHDTV